MSGILAGGGQGRKICVRARVHAHNVNIFFALYCLDYADKMALEWSFIETVCPQYIYSL